MVQVWTATAGSHPDVIPEQKVIDTYLHCTGGSDTGLYLLEFLKYWKNTGIYGHKIGAFLGVNPKNITAMKYANFLFGGVYLGFMLPLTARDQTGKVWDFITLQGDGAPGSWGGHCVDMGCYDGSGLWEVGTWGARQKLTDAFLMNYCDEAYAIVTLEWFTKQHKTPQGIAWKDLLNDLSLVSKLP